MAQQLPNFHPEYEALRREYLDFRYHLPAALVEIDLASLQVLYLNQCAEHLFGFSGHDVAEGLSIGAIVAPEDVSRGLSLIQSYVGESRSNGTPYPARERADLYEVLLRRKDGSTFVGEIRTRFVLDHAGVPVRMQTITRDISRQALPRG